ncbi:MAG TPA: inositol monophosphatase family protein [Actinomycetota bacterium]|nr:inositol monophosphatase family protein [Actinomycetota bacterium]
MNAELDAAARAAREAGALLLERFRGPARGVGTKSSGTDMVSDADRDAENVITLTLREAFPADAIFGEETGVHDGNSGRTWIVDPLDGTTNFLYGIPQWCVSIACEDERGGVAGVVYDPARDELFAAARGGGATLNGSPVHASTLSDVSKALVATGYGYEPSERERWGGVIARLLPAVRDVRRAGSAALDLAWTAAGRVDAYAEVPCRHWDRAAGVLIAAEAGCEISMLDPIGPAGDGVIAAPAALHEPLRAAIEEALSA